MVQRARYLLKRTRNKALGTVSAGGMAHVTVVSIVFRSNLDPEQPALAGNVWCDPRTRHVKNLAHTAGRVAVLIGNSNLNSNYLSLTGVMRELSFEDTAGRLPEFNSRRHWWGIDHRPLQDFYPDAWPPRRLYEMTVDGATMPASPLSPDGQWQGDGYAQLDLDTLRGFEDDPWRMQWAGEIGRQALQLICRS